MKKLGIMFLAILITGNVVSAEEPPTEAVEKYAITHRLTDFIATFGKSKNERKLLVEKRKKERKLRKKVRSLNREARKAEKKIKKAAKKVEKGELNSLQKNNAALEELKKIDAAKKAVKEAEVAELIAENTYRAEKGKLQKQEWVSEKAADDMMRNRPQLIEKLEEVKAE